VKSRVVCVGIFILVFLISFVAHIPARIISQFDHSPLHMFKMSQVNGTIWHGKAENVRILLQGKTLDLGSVQWNVHWSKLVFGKLVLETHFGQDSSIGLRGYGTFALMHSKVIISSLNAYFPVNSLARLIPSPIPFSTSGKGKLLLHDVILTNSHCEKGKGEFQWMRSHINVLSQHIDLGEIRNQLRCQNGAVLMQTDQASAMISSHFRTNLSENRSMTIHGILHPQDSIPETLKYQIERLPATKDNQGYKIQYKKQW